MTDGIIQEVFNRYSVALVKTSMDKRTYDLLEKELIERIKQRAYQDLPKDTPLNEMWIECELSELIGDNQE